MTEGSAGTGDRLRVPILHGCFFASGAAGLLYEVLWSRILGLTFGHTVYAVTTVLAAFMGGLALGSLAIGRHSDRWQRPIRLYGILEIGIGAYCPAAPSLLALARGAYLALPLSVSTIALGYVFLGEPVSGSQLAGTALVLAGVFVLSRKAGAANK